GALFATDSMNIAVNRVATRLVVTASPTNVVAGTDVTFTVSTVDQNGQFVNSRRDNVDISLNGTLFRTGTLPNGQQVVRITLTMPGTTATPASTPGLTSGGTSVQVTASSPAKLAFVQSPGAGVPKAPLPPAIVQIQDKYGNLVNSNETVSVSLRNNPT